MRQRKVCPKGHVFFKTPGCNSCPKCEAATSTGARLSGRARGARAARARRREPDHVREAREENRRAGARAAWHGPERDGKIECSAREGRPGISKGLTRADYARSRDMTENKTKPTKGSVAAFLKKAAKGQQLEDSQALVKLFRELTGKPAKMWGPSIVGFDSYHYVYPSGREGDAPLIGFAPRKNELVAVPRAGHGRFGPDVETGKTQGRQGLPVHQVVGRRGPRRAEATREGVHRGAAQALPAEIGPTRGIVNQFSTDPAQVY